MLSKKIDDINIDDINSLIENCVCENKSLDYKRELHIDTDSDKKEFLADISSFANANGGDIIYGIEEDSKEKIPTKIVGIKYNNNDELIRKLEDFIRQSIQPIILNIEYKILEIEPNKCILIIRIPQSLLSPHRVEYKGHNKFFTRNSKGKYQMDVSELRIAFNSGLDLEKRIEEYNNNRYYEILCNKYNKLLNDMPIFVIHYIPISSFNTINMGLSVSDMKKKLNELNSQALGYGYSKCITIDGISIEHKENERSSFAIYKNNGIIEKATTNFFKKEWVVESISPSPTIDFISGYQVIEKIIDDFNEVRQYYTNIGINPPIIISCAILNGVNYTIPTRDWYDILGKIDREILCIDNVYVEDFSKTTEEILKPIFDSIWNACGYTKCLAYDDNGTFIGLK